MAKQLIQVDATDITDINAAGDWLAQELGIGREEIRWVLEDAVFRYRWNKASGAVQRAEALQLVLDRLSSGRAVGSVKVGTTVHTIREAETTEDEAAAAAVSRKSDADEASTGDLPTFKISESDVPVDGGRTPSSPRLMMSGPSASVIAEFGTQKVKLGSFAPTPQIERRFASEHGIAPYLKEQALRSAPASQALNLLYRMTPAEVADLQLKMARAGFFSEDVVRQGAWLAGDPTDRNTMEAWAQLISLGLADPSRSISEHLDRRIGQFSHQFEKIRSGADRMTTEPLPDPDTIRQAVRAVSRDLLGRAPSEDELAHYVSAVTAEARQAGQAKGEAQLAASGGAPQPLPTLEGGGGAMGQFLQAIAARESGGNYSARSPAGAYGKYQFMPSTWRGAAREAGIDPNDRSAQAQEAVARHYAGQLHARYDGNWWLMALAWHGGTGTADRAARNGRGAVSGVRDRSFRQVTSVGYADDVVNRMGVPRQLAGGSEPLTGANAGGGATGGVSFFEQYDPVSSAEERIRRENPEEVRAVAMGDALNTFRQLIGGQ